MDDEYMSLEEEEDNCYPSEFDDHDQMCSNAEESDLQHSREPTSQVMEFLSVTENQARTLLIQYQWNVDKLFSVYTDQGKDVLFSRAEEEEGEDKEEEEGGEDEEEEEGGEDEEAEEGGEDEEAEEGVEDEEEEEDEKDDEVQLVSTELAEKFDRFLIESYVEDNNMVKWCPSTPHCGNAIRNIKDDGDVDEVECSCGLQFCFSCLSESHSPCSCLMWKLWKKKCEDESETVNWMTVNTKLCPKCSKPIQKRDGCNHMTCKCGQHFCWLCGQATGRDHSYSSIAGHSCGRYKEEKVRQLERAQRDLDRYTHYHYRYKAHIDSLKLEDKLKKSILKKAVLNSETKDQKVFKEYSWIIDAVNRLFRSRRILSYSYPFVFYMFGKELFKDDMSDEERNIKKNLFEDQQQQLEGNVERLSKILEEPFDEYDHEKVVEMMRHLTNLTAVVDNLCKEMYECIENELLGPLISGIHNIAPYRSKGIEQAAEFSASSACGSS
ncbi:unnamed protein product [Arabidopsis thaliana]|uniref:RBR-type E3 ubiquitin transferase n=1 Tax=Arabidopsis thaliana TaxID=3702 RepID=A0A654FBB6_ARATH|nr:IBR domain containing protein [Arabidopsis thaliana]AEE77356.1 IBR domain containing protein [Arabidopsis thaliana]VYS58833.1 unnamed protein product [Arabidopsis thaliana]|eukprot:NP_189409.1 IBR domain containing protein [Arabidopsis thaliana]